MAVPWEGKSGQDGGGLVMWEGCWLVVEAAFLRGFFWGCCSREEWECGGEKRMLLQERTVVSGGQGQTEPISAFLEATKGPIQRERTVCISLVWSGTQQHRIQSPFWNIGNKQYYDTMPSPLPVTAHLCSLVKAGLGGRGCSKKTRPSKRLASFTSS